MNQKSVTFRCSGPQHSRLHTALNEHHCSRTELITRALESFLDYAEQEPVSHMNLFELVDDVDTYGSGPKFAEQA